MPELRLEQVSKYYGDIEAVSEVSFTCHDGELLALLGPSGCGKSTLLRCLAGLETLTSGQIYFDAQPVSELSPAERNIAMVFEDYALYPHLTVAQNIGFPLRIKKFPGQVIKKKTDQLLQLLGLEDIRNDNVQSLSGGAQQRVSIGRALIRDPNLLLFDEPLSHLDGDQKVRLRMEIKRLQKDTGMTSILVTHDQTEAIAMCDRVVVMNLGRIQQCGSPAELYDVPNSVFVATFVGEPPMNLIPAELIQVGDEMIAAGADWKLTLTPSQTARLLDSNNQGDEVLVGIRPDALQVIPHTRENEAHGPQAVIELVEMRGESDVLVLSTGLAFERMIENVLVRSDPILIELSSGHSFSEGDQVIAGISPESCHLFDARTGRRV